MVTGTQREELKEKKNSKYVGFTNVEVRAVNPTRAELNVLLGKEDTPEDKEIVYKSSDAEGNDKMRMTFWLYDKQIDKYFAHSVNLVNKVRVSKDQSKKQYVNNVCMTAWADAPENLQAWFTTFTDREKNELGPKTFHEALVGEEEIASLLRVWLGRLNWNNPTASVVLNMANLFDEDYSELRGLIDGDFDTPFTALVGVRTDEQDSEKQYQQVYGKAFLPASFMGYINKGMKFPTEYSRKAWERFEQEVEGEYGFRAYFELKPLKEYDKSLDVTAIPDYQAPTTVTPVNSKY